MTAPAVSASAPAIPTINLADPADVARLPKQCWNCGSRGLFPGYPDQDGVIESTCMLCASVAARLVSHPVRGPVDWTTGRGRPRGRQCPDHPYSRLSHADVAEVRALAAAGMSSLEIARRYGISRDTAHKVVSRQTWRCVP